MSKMNKTSEGILHGCCWEISEMDILPNNRESLSGSQGV